MRRTVYASTPNKCIVKSSSSEITSSNGLEPDMGKIAAIVDMSPLTSAWELQSFLGMVNYTPNLAITTAPLRDLSRKTVSFCGALSTRKRLTS
ncbi:hypothetical protein LSAT2_000475 [Lamellibrachia satsuma]|nr:hypothetical protein LSAT2_000475 [Lamellibrachia satsuma]